MNIKQIHEILARHDYQVVLSQIDPQNLLLSFPEIIQADILETAPNDNIHYEIIENGVEINEKDYELKPYTIRPFIFSDVVKQCFLAHYNPLFLLFKIDDKEIDEDSFFQSLNISLDEQQSRKENELRELMVEFFLTEKDQRKDLEKKAKKANVLEDFLFIVKHLEN